MRNVMPGLLTLLVLPCPTTVAVKVKGPLPRTAIWDLKAFNVPFRVNKTTYDAKAAKATWVLELKEGVRTIDLIRSLDKEKPFRFVFLDGEDKELHRLNLSAADFQTIPKAKITKAGTRLTLTVEMPKGLAKVKKVILRRGPLDD
jgi:hypothetical protein